VLEKREVEDDDNLEGGVEDDDEIEDSGVEEPFDPIINKGFCKLTLCSTKNVLMYCYKKHEKTKVIPFFVICHRILFYLFTLCTPFSCLHINDAFTSSNPKIA